MIAELLTEADKCSGQFSLIAETVGKGAWRTCEYCAQGSVGITLSPLTDWERSTLDRLCCVGRSSFQLVEGSLLLNDRGLLCLDAHEWMAKSSTEGRPPIEGGADSGRLCVLGRDGEDGALYAALPGTHCDPLGTPWSDRAVFMPPVDC